MNSPLICDSGTGYLKIGSSDFTFPQYTIPAIVGRPVLRSGDKLGDMKIDGVYVGYDCEKYRKQLEISHPLAEGIVQDWKQMELIWDYAFKKLDVDPSSTSIFLTEPILNPDRNKIKMAESIFETFGFERMQVGVQALMSLFSQGELTGLLLDSGDGVTHCIPVVDSCIMQHQIQRINLAGRHVTEYFGKLLTMRGYALNSSADFEVIREMKEKYCFVSANIKQDRKLALETCAFNKEYKLPDGTAIKFGRERFEATEILFNPAVDGIDGLGTSQLVFKAINESPMDVRKDLYANIIISGGTSMFPGFSTRLENDMKDIYFKQVLKSQGKIKIKIDVFDVPSRKYNVFIGAGIYAKLIKDMPQNWVTKEDWMEMGPKVINKLQSSGM